jgi:hypothetical protein
MQNLNKISEELFAKIRGRFPSVTIGTEEGMITNNPSEARFIEFDYKSKGKVSLSLNAEDGLVVMHGADILAGENEEELSDWYNFLRELRQFAKKRLLNFDTRDITKSNLQKRDYKFLAKNAGEDQMTESKLYGTSRTSYQNVDGARLVIKHNAPINQESATGRTKQISSIYIESADGERFKYPFKHLSAARAMARHVAEGGNAYDDFGKHITGLSEEMAKLRKFKTYMGRSAVMAEGLEPYMDAVKGRMKDVKKTIESLQKPAHYAEAIANFESVVMEEVPADVAENWTDQLTIKLFNEELSDVFPYIYKLVSEATKAQELGPEDLIDEASKGIEAMKKAGNAKADAEAKERAKKDKSVDESGLQYHTGVKKHGKEYMVKAAQAGRDGASQQELGALKDKYSKAEKNKKTKEDIELEDTMEGLMGQFSEANEAERDTHCSDKCCGSDTKAEDCDCPPDCEGCNCNAEMDECPPQQDAAPQQQMAAEKPKTPLGEFILSYYDRETGSFPKGETAILTMVEKDYGDEYVRPAHAFIEKVHSTFVQHERMNNEQNDIFALAGI